MARGAFSPALRLTSSRGTRFLEPQHEFLNFGGTCFSEASFSRDDAKAALLEDTVRRDVVVSDARVKRARLINSQERVEGRRSRSRGVQKLSRARSVAGISSIRVRSCVARLIRGQLSKPTLRVWRLNRVDWTSTQQVWCSRARVKLGKTC
jgi:hypothetical protein